MIEELLVQGGAVLTVSTAPVWLPHTVWLLSAAVVFACAYKHARGLSRLEQDASVLEHSQPAPLPSGNAGITITEGQLLPDYPVIPELPLVRVVHIVEGDIPALPAEMPAPSISISEVIGAFQHHFVYNDMGVISNMSDLQIGMIYSVCGVGYTCLLCTWPLTMPLTNFTECLVDSFKILNYVATSNRCMLRYTEVNPYCLDPRLFGEGEKYLSFRLFYESSHSYATHLMAKNGLYNPLSIVLNNFYYEHCLEQAHNYIPPRTAGYRQFVDSESALSISDIKSEYLINSNPVLAKAYADLEDHGCLAEAMFGVLQQDIQIG